MSHVIARAAFFVLIIATLALILIYIWTGDQRWAATAFAVGFPAFLMTCSIPLWWGGDF